MRPVGIARPCLLLALAAASGCTADLLPVTKGTALPRLLASGLANLATITVVDSDGPKVVAAGGREDKTVLLTQVDGTFRETVLPSGWQGPIRGVAAGLGSEVAVVGDGQLARGELTRLGPSTSPGPLRLVAITADPTGAYFVAAEGAALRLSGESLQPLFPPGSSTTSFEVTLLAVHAAASGEVLFAGDAGLLYRSEGEALRPEASGTTTPLRALAQRDGQPLYAVGGSTTAVVLRREAGLWSPVPLSPLEEVPPLFGAAVDHRGNLWCVGSGGTFLHFDGVTWRSIPTGYPNEPFVAVTTLEDQVYLAGSSVILRYDAEE